MVRKKLTRKAKIAYALLRDEGSLAVGIRTLEFLQKKSRRHKRSIHIKHGIYTGALYDEILTADIAKPVNTDWVAKNKKSYTFNWLMPPPGKGSGGHMTLFRFIKQLELAGHTCRIYFFNPGPGSSVEAVQAIMGDAFPKLEASMEWLEQDAEMKPADGIFATSWQTAYTVYNSKVKAKKFYFVQDFEPYFYPVGGFYTLAENTYKLGLRGITAGGWLEKKLDDEYGMKCDHFWFGVDKDIYTYHGNTDRKEIVFYARPTTERRAFELGILTLDLFHRKHPDYTINFVGWDVSDYNIPFPHKNLGILDPTELNELYNKCSASLVMSLTNMSLLPLELLGAGCIPVVTDGENNRLVSDNSHIAYSPADPVSLANTLSRVVARKDIDTFSVSAAESITNDNWGESGEHFVKVVETSLKTKGNG